MLAYLNGHYLPKDEIFIAPDDRGFLFADALYEIIRSYEGRLFETQAHFDRLKYGARELRFTIMNLDHLAEVAKNLIQKNNLLCGDATIYIQVTRGAAPRTHHFPPLETPLTIYVSGSPFLPHKTEIEKGVDIIMVSDQRWARCDIKTVGLTANVLANQLARERNAFEAVFVRDGTLLEGTHTNIFAVFDGKVITPPKTNYILAGITRDVVLSLCQKLGLPFQERPIFESQIDLADELMIVGTTVEITPIVKINGKKFGSGEPGTITRRLQKAFRELTTLL